MRRLAATPRRGWEAIIEEQGLVHWRTPLPDGSEISYWNERACYSLTPGEVDQMRGAAANVMEMLVQAGESVIERDLFSRLGIPMQAVPQIKETWLQSAAPTLFGRFDFAYSDGHLKLLEYNTEASVVLEAEIQRRWARDVLGAKGRQWNGVHEALVARWKELNDTGHIPGDRVHLLYPERTHSEDSLITVRYLARTAGEAGLRSELLPIEQVGYNPRLGFVDLAEDPIRTAFKFYPWSWMVRQRIGRPALDRTGPGEGETVWIEPIWTMLLLSKGILPVLWEMFPDHPNLLPAYFEGEQPEEMRSFVRKPLLASQGTNVSVVIDGELVEAGPDRGHGTRTCVVQQYVDLGEYGGDARPVLGVWTVGTEPVGLGIWEPSSLITTETSQFVPHVVEQQPPAT